MSHLSRVRGLKRSYIRERNPTAWSHLSRVRGLKRSGSVIITDEGEVAPFTGAWIETCGAPTMTVKRRVAPFTGAWIETSLTSALELNSCRTFHGCVD